MLLGCIGSGVVGGLCSQGRLGWFGGVECFCVGGR